MHERNVKYVVFDRKAANVIFNNSGHIIIHVVYCQYIYLDRIGAEADQIGQEMANLRKYNQPDQDFVPENTDDESLVYSIKTIIRKMILFEPSSRVSMASAAEELKSLGGK